MNHLSSEQISHCLIGGATPEAAAHVRECKACRAELERLETVLTRFRSSVRQWSDSRIASQVYRVSYSLDSGNRAAAGVGSVLSTL